MLNQKAFFKLSYGLYVISSCHNGKERRMCGEYLCPGNRRAGAGYSGGKQRKFYHWHYSKSRAGLRRLRWRNPLLWN